MGIHTPIDSLLRDIEVSEQILSKDNILNFGSVENILIVDVLTLLYDLGPELERFNSPLFLARLIGSHMIAQISLSSFTTIFLTSEGPGYRSKYRTSYLGNSKKFIHINKNLADRNILVSKYIREYIYANSVLDPQTSRIVVVSGKTEADVQIASIIEMYVLNESQQLTPGEIDINKYRTQSQNQAQQQVRIEQQVRKSLMGNKLEAVTENVTSSQTSETGYQGNRINRRYKPYASKQKPKEKRHNFYELPEVEIQVVTTTAATPIASNTSSLLGGDSSGNLSKTRLVIWTSDSDILITAGSLNCPHVDIVWFRKMKMYSLCNINAEVAILLILFGCDRLKRLAPNKSIITYNHSIKKITCNHSNMFVDLNNYPTTSFGKSARLPSILEVRKKLKQWNIDESHGPAIRKVLKYYTHGKLLLLQ